VATPTILNFMRQEVSWLTIGWNRNPLHPPPGVYEEQQKKEHRGRFRHISSLAARLSLTWLGKILAGFMGFRLCVRGICHLASLGGSDSFQDSTGGRPFKVQIGLKARRTNRSVFGCGHRNPGADTLERQDLTETLAGPFPSISYALARLVKVVRSRRSDWPGYVIQVDTW
jgi:hypothetical protein